MSDQPPLPDGFAVGHHSDREGMTGCTVILPPPEEGAAGVFVTGGGPGTRETDSLSPLSRAEGCSAVLLTGGSAFGLAAADGVARWLEEQGRGHATPAGLVPIVPAAVVYDIASGDPKARPGPEDGYAACEAAAPGVPETGAVGAGTGATVAKALGREAASPGGLGYAAVVTGAGETVSAIAAVNAAGDILAEDGSLIAGPMGEDGRMQRGADLLVEMPSVPIPELKVPEGNTTLVCVCTDAALDKREAGMVARAATAGIARAVNPTFTPVDGDVVFCMASATAGGPHEGTARPMIAMQIGVAAATATAQAIRQGVRAVRQP